MEPAFKRDIQQIERVQKRATRCIIGLSGKSYEERLGILKLESLAKRRCVFDLIKVYKICHNSSSLSVDKFSSTKAVISLGIMILSFSKNRFALTAEKVISEWNWLLPHIALCDLIRNY